MRPPNNHPTLTGADARAGMSLLETLLAMSLLLMISAIAFTFCARFSQRYKAEMQAGGLTSAGSRGIGELLGNLRMAGYPPAPQENGTSLFPAGAGLDYTGATDNLVAQGFSAISGSAMTFTAALGNRGAVGAGGNTMNPDGLVVDQVQFTLAPMPAATAGGCRANPQMAEGSLWELRRTVAPEDTSGAPQLGTAPATDPWPFNPNPAMAYSTVLDGIVSASAAAPSIFSYYDASGNVTATPANVAEVQVAFTLQTCNADQKDRMPIELPFSGVAFVRNSGN